MVCLVKHAAKHEDNLKDATFIILSTLGGIDIPMTLVNAQTNNNVFIDNGRKNNRKLLCINTKTLSTGQKKAILKWHAFTCTDKNSLFRKCKMRCWKIAQGYLSTFSNVGKEFEVTDGLIKELEECGSVCMVAKIWA